MIITMVSIIVIAGSSARATTATLVAIRRIRVNYLDP